jgi:hypothetical protein
MTENTRIHKRVPIAGSAALSFRDAGVAVSTKALVSNVSLSGIGLYAERQVEDGTDVSVEINFMSLDGTIKKTVMKGRVVYTRGMDTLYFTGIEFNEEITPEKQSDLYSYIQQSLKWY